MKEYDLTDPIYDAEVILLVGGDISDLEKRTGESELVKNCPAYALKPKESYDTPFFLWVSRPTVPMICHELMHITFYVLQDRGIVFAEESEEAFTYWFESMLIQIINRLLAEEGREGITLLDRCGKIENK